MKCQRCHRELKSHTDSGMGKICQMKASKLTDSIKTRVRVEPLFIRYQERRSYLVFTSPRAKVVINETPDGKRAECEKCPDKCEHIEIVAKVDNKRFPQGH